MDTWTPLWSQIVESTLWEEPLEVRVLFLTMLAIKDADHQVMMAPRRLAKKANMPLEVVENALKVLLAPDPLSSHQNNEGRRLKAVEGGWFIINGDYYRREMAKLQQRLRKTQWQREQRELSKTARRKGQLPLPGENAHVQGLTPAPGEPGGYRGKAPIEPPPATALGEGNGQAQGQAQEG